MHSNCLARFPGKKHQTRLREKSAAAPPDAPAPPVQLSARMKEIASAVVGRVTAADVGEHEHGIYCKPCRTVLFCAQDGLQAHLRGERSIPL